MKLRGWSKTPKIELLPPFFCFFSGKDRLLTANVAEIRGNQQLYKGRGVPEVLFRRLLCVARLREINLKEVLSYELTAVPPALFYNDGSMRNVTKSELACKLEECVPMETALETAVHMPTAYIVDGMSLVQGVNEAHFQTILKN